MVNLSRLEEIKDLRTVWPHEVLDFNRRKPLDELQRGFFCLPYCRIVDSETERTGCGIVYQ